MTPQFKALNAALLGSALAFSSAAYAQDIKVGFNGDLSASPSAQSGQAGVLGIQAAIDDINAAGGVLGRKLTLVVRDDLSQPPKSIQNMSDLIDNEKVVAVLGPTNSGNALAWKHIPNQKKNPSIGCIGSATDITKPMGANADNYMYRVSMVDRAQVAGLIAYAKSNPKTKNVGFLVETTGYGQGGLKDLQELADAKGLKPVATEKFGVNDTDMTSQLNKMKAAGVDTVLVWAQGTPIGQLVRSMEKINYFPVTLTSWSSDNASFFDTAGKTLAEKPVFMRTITEDRTPKQQAALRSARFEDGLEERLQLRGALLRRADDHRCRDQAGGGDRRPEDARGAGKSSGACRGHHEDLQQAVLRRPSTRR